VHTSSRKSASWLTMRSVPFQCRARWSASQITASRSRSFSLLFGVRVIIIIIIMIMMIIIIIIIERSERRNVLGGRDQIRFIQNQVLFSGLGIVVGVA
jgi:hypothetical protein